MDPPHPRQPAGRQYLLGGGGNQNLLLGGGGGPNPLGLCLNLPGPRQNPPGPPDPPGPRPGPPGLPIIRLYLSVDVFAYFTGLFVVGEPAGQRDMSQ